MNTMPEFVKSLLFVPVIVSGTSTFLNSADIESPCNTISMSDSYFFGNDFVADSDSTAEVNSSQGVFYGAIADGLVSFLKDEEDLDYSDFEARLKELISYNEIRQFCSYFLCARTDTDIRLFLNGILETDIDIYEQTWYQKILQSIVESKERTPYLKQSAKVILDEYYR